MIVVDEKDWLIVITQPDHARFAAELLSLWRRDGLPQHPRRREILFATREHDNGWQEADSAPRVDPETRFPMDFLRFPESDRLELWQRGILRYADARPVAALLIAEHAERMHQPLSPAWIDFFASLGPSREQWLEAAGLDREIIRRDYAFVNLADTLSLALCMQARDPIDHPAIGGRVIGDRLRLHPFPLAGTTTFVLPRRRVENRPFVSDADFAGALARARWERWQVKIEADPDHHA